jgi:hypothetical protein
VFSGTVYDGAALARPDGDLMSDWAAVSKRTAIRRYGAIGARCSEASAGVSGPRPFRRPGVSKTELREQAAEAMASYEGPITRCAPKRRKAGGSTWRC